MRIGKGEDHIQTEHHKLVVWGQIGSHSLQIQAAVKQQFSQLEDPLYSAVFVSGDGCVILTSPQSGCQDRGQQIPAGLTKSISVVVWLKHQQEFPQSGEHDHRFDKFGTLVGIVGEYLIKFLQRLTTKFPPK